MDRYVVTDTDSLASVRQAWATEGGRERVILVGEGGEGECTAFHHMVLGEDGSLYDSQSPRTDPHTDIAAMPYSSGTTGPPKGVLLSHFNLVANTCQALAPGVRPGTCSSPQEGGRPEVVLAALPFSHIFSLTLVVLAQLRHGNTLVTLPQYRPETYVRALASFKPTLLALVPPILSFLATSRSVKYTHLDSVKVIVGGAAHFGPGLISSFMEKVPEGSIEFREGFGMTETSSMALCQPGEGAMLGGCGSPVANTLARWAPSPLSTSPGAGWWTPSLGSWWDLGSRESSVSLGPRSWWASTGQASVMVGAQCVPGTAEPPRGSSPTTGCTLGTWPGRTPTLDSSSSWTGSRR